MPAESRARRTGDRSRLSAPVAAPDAVKHWWFETTAGLPVSGLAQWFILAAAAPIIFCAGKLNLDLWYDEVYTLDFFVSRSFEKIVTDYSAPNNHIFYSLLLRPVYLLSDSNFALRFPSLVAVIGTLWLVFRIGSRAGGLAAGMMSVLWLGLTQMYLGHAMQVRGYGVSMLLAAWLGDLATRPAGEAAPGKAEPARFASIAIVGGLFLYTIPTNALTWGPLAVAAILWRGLQTRRAAPVLAEVSAWTSGAILAVGCYWPVRDALGKAAGSEWVSPLDAIIRSAETFYSVALRDAQWAVPVLLVAAGVGIVRLVRQRELAPWAVPVLSAIMLLGPFVATAFLRQLPFVRTYCPLLPFLALALGWSSREAVRILDAMGRRIIAARWAWWIAPALGLGAVALLLLPADLTYPRRLTEYRQRRFAQDGYFNYYAANFEPSAAAAWLRDNIPADEPYRVAWDPTGLFVINRYLARVGIPPIRPGSDTKSEGAYLYCVAPVLADWDFVSQETGIDAATLRGFPVVERFGYFQIHRSPSPVIRSRR